MNVTRVRMSRTVVIASRASSCVRFSVLRLAVAGSWSVEESGSDILTGGDLDSVDVGAAVNINTRTRSDATPLYPSYGAIIRGFAPYLRPS